MNVFEVEPLMNGGEARLFLALLQNASETVGFFSADSMLYNKKKALQFVTNYFLLLYFARAS